MMHIAKEPSHQRTAELFPNQSGKRDRLHLSFIVFCTIALHYVTTYCRYLVFLEGSSLLNRKEWYIFSPMKAHTVSLLIFNSRELVQLTDGMEYMQLRGTLYFQVNSWVCFVQIPDPFIFRLRTLTRCPVSLNPFDPFAFGHNACKNKSPLH